MFGRKKSGWINEYIHHIIERDKDSLFICLLYLSTKHKQDKNNGITLMSRESEIRIISLQS